jgi:hypothetical protein
MAFWEKARKKVNYGFLEKSPPKPQAPKNFLRKT